MAVAAVLAQCHLAYRLEKLEAQVAAMRAEEEATEAVRVLPKCVCAAGDPLCSEIPGQTCAPKPHAPEAVPDDR